MKSFEKRFIEIIEKLKNKESQASIAAKIDIAPQSLSQILKGKRSPTTNMISKLFTSYGIEPNSIFFEEEHADQELTTKGKVAYGTPKDSANQLVNESVQEYLKSSDVEIKALAQILAQKQVQINELVEMNEQLQKEIEKLQHSKKHEEANSDSI